MRRLRRAGVVVLTLTALAACKRSEPRPDRTSGLTSSPAAEPAEAPASNAGDERVAERAAMVSRQLAGRDIDDERVLAAMRKVPRHAFVPSTSAGKAYADRPLPIGHGQTISQPYIVAFMTQAARPRAESRCLEIGTGSGYQAAVLAELCRETFSIEYLPGVAAQGAANLRRAGYGARVALRVGDGYVGWPEAAPFDVILVTAAPRHVPTPLLEQLGPGGRLVIPVGPHDEAQELERHTRTGTGSGTQAFERERLMGVRFVPFLGDAARASAP